MMKFGLKNIILHHSYFRNKRCKIACGGHTNNTGANGAGKTSALQLIPVFYGYSPEKIINKEAGKLSFLDYYLPNINSLIVFEYERVDGYACAVLYRHAKNAKLIYRFVKGRADETLFADFMDEHYQKGLPSAEIFKLLEQNGIQTSHNIGLTVDYKAIISNDRQRLYKNKDNKLIYEAQNFSLCDNNKKMNHIGEMTAVLLNSNQLLFKLREMLASILVGQDHLNIKPNMNQSDKLISTIKSLQKINAQQLKLSNAVANAHQLLKVYGKLKHHQRQALTYFSEFNHQHHQIQAQKNAIDTDWHQKQENYQNVLDDINAKISEANGEKLQQEKQVNQLIEQYQIYLMNDMQGKAQEVRNLALYESQYDEYCHQYDLLNQGFQELRDNHYKECDRIKSIFNEHKAQLDKQIHDVNEQVRRLANERQLRIDESYRQEQEFFTSFNDEQEKQKQLIWDKVSESRLQLQQAKFPSNDEQLELQNYEQKINEIEANIERQNIIVNNSNATYQDSKKQYDDYLNEYQKLAKQLHQDKEQEREYRKAIYESGTLLDFLDNSQTAWRETIGKLINPELLLRKDLSPSFQLTPNEFGTSSNDDFYGLVLDTSQISLSDIAKDRGEIADLLNGLMTEIEHKTKQLNILEKTLYQANDLQKSSYQQYELSKQRLSQYEKELKTHKNVLVDIKQKHAKNAEYRLQIAQDQLDNNELAYQTLLNEQKRQNAKRKQEFDNKRQAIQQSFALKEEQYQNQIDNIKSQMTEYELQKTHQLTAQEVAYQKALANEGVDEKTLNDVKKQRDIAKQRFDKIKSYQKEVFDYEYWLENRYCYKDKWQDELYEKEEYHQALCDKKEQIKNQQKEQQVSYNNQLAKLNKQLDELVENQKQLDGLSQRFDELFLTLGDGWQLSEYENHYVSLEVFFREANETLDEQKYKVNILQDVYRQALNALDGDIAQAWQERMERHRHQSGLVGYWLSAMRELEEMLNRDIPDKMHASIEQFRAISNDINAYYDKISEFNRAVKALSDKLSNQINNEQHFLALRDIQIKLYSSLSKDDMYYGLKSFCGQCRELGELETLPDDNLLDSFYRAVNLLNNHNIDTAKTATFIELEILCTEQGREFRLTHHSDLTKASSTGISMMLIVVLFASLTRYLCNDENLAIHWPLDEIGRIDNKNTEDLFDFMNRQNIYLFCAEPELNPTKAKLFEYKNDMDRTLGVRVYQKSPKKDNPLLMNGGH